MINGPGSAASHMVNGLRSICARHHDLFVRNMPNLWLAICRALVDTFVLVFAAELALTGVLVADEIGASALQHEQELLAASITLTWLTTTSVVTCWYLAWSMINELAQPFNTEAHDVYNPDALLGSTERTLFANLRVTFDAPAIEEEARENRTAQESQ